MLVKKLRLQKSWSQEQLATLSGLSTRTIQRIEGGESVGYETLKSLASVFEIDVADLTQHYLLNTKEISSSPSMISNIDKELFMEPETQLNYEEANALEYVKELKGLYIHIAMFLIIMLFLISLNLINTPNHYWFVYPLIGWGLGLAGHAISLFGFFNLGAKWEKKQVEKRLGRKL